MGKDCDGNYRRGVSIDFESRSASYKDSYVVRLLPPGSSQVTGVFRQPLSLKVSASTYSTCICGWRRQQGIR